MDLIQRLQKITRFTGLKTVVEAGVNDFQRQANPRGEFYFQQEILSLLNDTSDLVYISHFAERSLRRTESNSDPVGLLKHIL